MRYPRSAGFSEAICQPSTLQKGALAKTVNHFLLSDSTHGSNLWNSFGYLPFRSFFTSA